MANLVSNVLQFDCTPERFQEIAESLKTRPEEPLGDVDFDKLIPRPWTMDIEHGSREEKGYEAYKEFAKKASLLDDDEKDELEASYRSRFSDDPEVWELGKQYYLDSISKGASNWWDWCWDNWSSPYNAFECCPVKPEDRRLEFTTSWSFVPKIVIAISQKFPDVLITYKWYVRAPGNECGDALVRGGKCIEHHEWQA